MSLKNSLPCTRPSLSCLCFALALLFFVPTAMAQDEAPPEPSTDVETEAPEAEPPAPPEEPPTEAEPTPEEEAPAEPAPEEPAPEETPDEEAAPEGLPTEGDETGPEEDGIIDEASAPEAVEDTEPEEEITVTGSRIGRNNLEDYAQITVLTSKDIEMSGVTDIDALLRVIPVVNLSSAKTESPTGGGMSGVSLRNLGSARTLVLVNGRRMTVTLGDIPVTMIERVEILTDGASAIYGTDAISGAVNIILKQDFNGFDVAANGGISTYGDGAKYGASATYGINGDRGNLTFNLTYNHRNAIRVRDRDWAHPPCETVTWNPSVTGETMSVCGSPTVPGGTVFFWGEDPASFSDMYVFQGPDGHFHQQQTIYEEWVATQPGTPYDMYNWGEEMVLTSGVDKFQVLNRGHFEFSEFVTGYIETIYAQTRGYGRYAGLPVTGDSNENFPSALLVPLSSPFIPDAFWNDVINQYGINYDTPYIEVNKRTNDMGARIFDNAHNEFNTIVGLRGEIAPGYEWDIFFNYGRTNSFSKTQNSIDMQRFLVSIDPEECYAMAGCVVANLLGEGVLQPEMREFIAFDSTSTWEWQMINAGAHFLMEPFELPGGQFAVVIGGDVRTVDAASHPDSKLEDGVSASTASSSTVGSFSAQEAFAEVRAPLLSDIPAVDLLEINLAGRASHYNLFGTEFTYRAQLLYAPIKDVRLRGVASTSYRAPSIGDLYGGGGAGYPTVLDPCSNYEQMSQNPNSDISEYTIAQCDAAGLNSADLGENYVQLGSQVRQLSNPNPNLGPETSRTLSVGTVVQPTFMPRELPVSLTFDFYKIWIYDAITFLGAADILRNCYTLEGYNDYCEFITRSPDNGQIVTVDASIRNVGRLETSGFDFTANVGFPLYQMIRGNLSFQGNILRYVTETNPQMEQAGEEGATQEYTGQIAPAGGGDPKFRFVSGLGIGDHMWNFNNRVRFVTGMEIQDAQEGAPYTDVEHVAYWDMSASLNLGAFNVAIGVDNVTNRIPPYLPGSHYNGNIAMYDTIGRYFWTRLNYTWE